MIVLLITFFCSVASARSEGKDTYFEPIRLETLWATGMISAVEPRRLDDAIQTCAKTSAVTSDLSTCQYLKLFRPREVESLSAALAKTSADILIFGERHLDHLEVSQAIVETLPKLKANGFTTLGVEMFNSSSQGLLDQYQKGAISRAELTVSLQQQWTYPPKAYIDTIEQATALGFKVVALDGRDLPGIKPNAHTLARELSLRDAHMAQIISQTFRDGDRWLLLTGAHHAVKNRVLDGSFQTLAESLRDLIPAVRINTYAFVSTRELNPIRRTLLQNGEIRSGASLYRVDQEFFDGYIVVERTVIKPSSSSKR